MCRFALLYPQIEFAKQAVSQLPALKSELANEMLKDP